MELTNAQVTELLSELSKTEAGFNKILQKSFEALMKAERSEHLSGVDTDKGNGYRQTRVFGSGKMLELRVPRTRQGNFYPYLLSVLRDQDEESRRLAVSLYRSGLTTEQVGDIFEEVYGRHYSKASVSNMFEQARQEVKEWLERPLEGYYPIVFVDATFVSTNRDGEVSKEAYYTLLGVRADKTREVLAIVNFPSESSTGWGEVFRGVKERGVKKVDLVVSDDLRGIDDAIAKEFTKAKIQGCTVHLTRTIGSKVKAGDKKEVAEDLSEVFLTEEKGDSPRKGWERFEAFCGKWAKRYPIIGKMAKDNHYQKFFTYLGYHRKIRRYIHTTNWIERLNRDYKRVLRMRGAMPNPDSVIFLMGQVAIHKKAYLHKVPLIDRDESFGWETN